jgi:hypothetical protein
MNHNPFLPVPYIFTTHPPISVCDIHNFEALWLSEKSRDISVGIALGYGLDDRGSRIRFPAGVGNFSLHHRIQTGSGVHPASCPVVTRGSFLGGKAVGA